MRIRKRPNASPNANGENKMAVKTATINGRKYKIFLRKPVDGLCSIYKMERAIELFVPLNTQNGLITTIHECLHASRWSETEDVVDRTSTDIGRLLWRLGYRRQA